MSNTNDLLVRLLLKTDDFNRNLGSAKRNVNTFQGSIKGMAGKAGAALGKLAGTVGLAMGAYEAFNKVMHSSQALGDKYASTMEAAKTSVDQFFYSLGNGEFSSFLTGMDDIISKAQEAYAAMDQLGNAKISYSFVSSENMANIQEGQYYAKNKLAPMDVRKQGFKTWQDALLQQAEHGGNLQKAIEDAVVKAVSSEIGTDSVRLTLDDVKMALRIDILNPKKRDELKDRYASDYKEYRKKAHRLSDMYQHVDSNGNVVSRDKAVDYRPLTSEERQRAEQKLADQYKDAIVVNAMLNKYKDDELKEIASMLSEYSGLTSAIKSLSREYNEAAMEFNNSMKGAEGFSPVESLEGYQVYVGNNSTSVGTSKGNSTKASIKEQETAAIGSIAFIDQQLKQKRDEFFNTTDDRVRRAAQIMIDNLELAKKNMQFDAKYGGKPGKLDSKPVGLNLGITAPDKLPILNDAEEKTEKVDNLNDSLLAMGQIYGSLGSIAASTGDDFMAATANMLGNIGQMIMQLQALATAQGTASASKLPFPANIAAIATIVSTILSVFSSLKFAAGGIVPGTSFSGDRVPAMLNSGEMVLNTNQQRRLFAMANGGYNGNNVNVSGNIRVNGKDLYISLRNYMKSSGNKL